MTSLDLLKSNNILQWMRPGCHREELLTEVVIVVAYALAVGDYLPQGRLLRAPTVRSTTSERK